jgi:hypothetical protein
VPDDPAYRAAFLGAIQQLGAAYKWADDPDHNALIVAQVWRNIADALEKCLDEIPVIRVYEDDTMPLRVDCDCNVFVTCCDGSEIQLATLADVRSTNQPGTGTRPPIGQSTCYSVTLNAKNTWLLPFSVSSGDVLTVSELGGAWSDDGISWTCPDGTPFVFGLCAGSRYHVSGDPSGSLYHGQLVFLIDGAYYSATDGAFTVPGGISNAQCTLVSNIDRTLASAGDVVFKICAENGGTPPTGTWCALLNFKLSDFGWVSDTREGYGATWIPGTGFAGLGGLSAKVIELKYTFGATTEVTAATLYGHNDNTPRGDSSGAIFVPVPNTVAAATPIPNIGDWTIAGSTARTGTVIAIGVQDADAVNMAVTGIMIEGSGTIPAGWTPC